jgi:hypothetical protein
VTAGVQHLLLASGAQCCYLVAQRYGGNQPGHQVFSGAWVYPDPAYQQRLYAVLEDYWAEVLSVRDRLEEWSQSCH